MSKAGRRGVGGHRGSGMEEGEGRGGNLVGSWLGVNGECYVRIARFLLADR